MQIEIQECKKSIPCVDCKDTSCILHGKKESDCPKYHCDRPDSLKFECNNCAFIDKYIEDMRKQSRSE